MFETETEVEESCGVTRRLFRISSVSVRMKTAPTSSIHRLAGKPMGVAHAFLKSRMNSAFGKGFGDAMFTTPVTSSRSISHCTALTKSSWSTHCQIELAFP